MMRAEVRAEEVGRWPAWIYGEGTEPDPRFSFANERTFLAWVRTSMGLSALGIAVDALPLAMPLAAKTSLSVSLLLAGSVSVTLAWVRWAQAERAVRREEPLPPLILGAVLAGIILTATVASVVLILTL